MKEFFSERLGWARLQYQWPNTECGSDNSEEEDLAFQVDCRFETKSHCILPSISAKCPLPIFFKYIFTVVLWVETVHFSQKIYTAKLLRNVLEIVTETIEWNLFEIKKPSKRIELFRLKKSNCEVLKFFVLSVSYRHVFFNHQSKYVNPGDTFGTHSKQYSRKLNTYFLIKTENKKQIRSNWN